MRDPVSVAGDPPPAARRARRLFFALWPDAPERAKLIQAARKVLDGTDGRPVAAGDLHLTLVFLGSVAEERLSQVAAIAAATAAVFPSVALPLRVELTHVEHWKKAQLLSAAVGSEPTDPSADAVAVLAQALRDQLLESGFTPDLKPFRPHVTLARKVRHGSRDAAKGPHGRRLELSESVSWRFDEFALIESRAMTQGALYSVVDSWPLSKARAR